MVGSIREKLFVSGPFTGKAPFVRKAVRETFADYDIDILEKNGAIQEPAAKLIAKCDGIIFILGATAPAIEDVWGRTLVELELAFARNIRKPIIPILLDVADEKSLDLRVSRLQTSLRQQFGEKLTLLDGFLDDAQLPTSEERAIVAKKMSSLAHMGWRRFAGMWSSDRVFISHSHADRAKAEQILNELLRYEFNPWLDNYQIKAGSDLSRSIQRAIELSGSVLVLLSKSSVASDWVKKEVRQALEIEIAREGESGGYILPVRLESVELPEELKFLESRLYIDLFGSIDTFNSGMRKIILALRTRDMPDSYM